MTDEITAYEKGLAFEQRLAQLFRGRGYEVQHDVRLTGRSGAPHQIDILARLEGPLHTSTIIVEAKSYRSAIDKDRVMKLIYIVDDLGADRGIVVTTSHFLQGALQTAEERKNIELWDRNRLQELLGEMEIAAVEAGLPSAIEVAERVVAPRFAERIEHELTAEAEKKSKGGLLGMGKIEERIEHIALVYYPYYEAAVDWPVTEKQRAGLLKKEVVRKFVPTKVAIDAVMGCLVAANEKGVSYDFTYLMPLGADEVTVLRAVGQQKFDARALLALGFSEGKTKKILAGLLHQGIISQLSSRPAVYQVRRSLPDDPRFLTAISDHFELAEHPEHLTSKYGGPIKEASAIARLIESYWPGALVRTMSLLYYPYVICFLARPDGTRRTTVVDAVTRQPSSSLEVHRWHFDKAQNASGEPEQIL